jgi:hypothetical protein
VGTIKRHYSNNGQLTIDTGGNSVNFGGGIIQGMGHLGITKTGAGTQTLSGSQRNHPGNHHQRRYTAHERFGLLGGSSSTASDLSCRAAVWTLGGTSQTRDELSITAAAASGNTIENGNLTAVSYSASLATGNAIITANLLGAANLTKSGTGT